MANSKKPSTAAPAASEPVVAPVAAAAPAAAPAAKKAPSKKADAAAPVAAPVVAAPVATEAAPAAKKAPSKKAAAPAAAAPAAAAPAATTEAAPASTDAAAPAKKAPVKKAAAAPAVATEAAPASTDAAAPKAKASRSKKQEAAPAAPAAPSAIIVDVEVPESKAPLDARGRRIVSKDTVRDDFSSLIALINEQVEKASAPAPAAETPAAEGDAATAEGAAKKTTKRKKVEVGLSMKTLRSISKRLTVLTSDACKMMKLKNKISRDNTNSGLMKPVGLSDALFKFLKAAKFEVDAKGQYARTDITKKLHAYIKDNNLRKETDKRIIVPDTKLAALLNYDANTANEEMTYFRLPVYLKSHFVKLE